LCEMAARKDPALKRLASGSCVKIAACYPRAVKWLFASAGAPLDPAKTEVLNMRESPAPQVLERLFAGDLQANLPAGKNAKDDSAVPTTAHAGATSAEAPASS
jgi:hypothetical protein